VTDVKIWNSVKAKGIKCYLTRNLNSKKAQLLARKILILIFSCFSKQILKKWQP